MFFEEISLKVIYNGKYVKMTIYPWDAQGKFALGDVDYFIGVYTNESFVDVPLIEMGEISPGIFTELSRVSGVSTPFVVIEKALEQVYSGKKKVTSHI
jgi:hypothetical protein